MAAPADGVVFFVGLVAGDLFVTIDHGDGYRSTDAWLAETLVRRGQAVKTGDVVALSGRGHPELPEPQLHFGVKLDGTSIDPLTVLAPRSVVDLIRLTPLSEGRSAGTGATAPPMRPVAGAGPEDPAVDVPAGDGLGEAEWIAAVRVRGPPWPT